MPIEISRAAGGRPAGVAVAAKPGRARPAKSGAKGLRIGGPAPITAKERMFFTERLELLLETGVPLHSALETLEAQVGSPELSRVIHELVEDVTGGLSFSQALGKHPDAFPATYANLVAAGEQGGFLPKVLERLREMDERREELRSTLLSSFSYPAFLVIFSAVVVVFVLVVVFPKFAEIFDLIRGDLPITTRFLMATSEFLRERWPLALGGFVGLFGGGWLWLRTPEGAETFDGLVLRLPVVRDISVQYQLVQLMHVLSLSLANGVPLLEALRASRDTLPSAGFRRFVADLQTRVTEGRGVASGFEEARFLPALVPQMVSTAEASGSLAAVTGRVADFYERELRKRLHFVAKIVEPVMLLVMGVVVGLIVSSLLLPIFKLSTTVH